MAETSFDFLNQNAEQNMPASSPAPKGDDFTNMFNSMNAETSQQMQERPLSITEKFNAPVGPKSMVYTPDSSVDMYRYQEGFQGDKFNPLDTSNYQKWANKETFGSALSKGFDSFGYKFGNTFVDYWKGYGRMADALVNMDWEKMKPDEATLADQYYKDQMDMNKNFVFEQPENEDSIFSKRTMSEFIGNAGFALGTFAGLGLEIAADIAITAATGGAGAVTFGATATRVGARVAAETAAKTAAKSGYRFADTLLDLGKGFSYGNRSAEELAAAGKVIKQIDQASDLAKAGTSTTRAAMEETFNIFSNNLLNITKSKNFTELGANIAKGTPLLGTGIRAGEKLIAASKAGANTSQLLGIGAQGIRRVAQELNMSATEASFEAVSSYGDTLDKMVQQYKAENQDAVPTAQEFEDMRKLAMKAGTSNYNANMALLLATNKLQFGNLFNKFIPANKFMSEVAENLLVVEGKTGAGIFKKGFFGTYGLTGQIAKEFGKKQAAYQVGKAFGKDFLQFELSEGIQENLQETSGAAWKDYYAGQFNGVKMSLSEAFAEGASDQFSKQGLKTFLMGALTGSIIRVPTALATKSFDAANNAVINKQYASDPNSNPLVLADKQLDEDIRVQNALFKQAHDGKFKDKLFNFAAQVNAAQEQSEAASKGMRYEFENGKDNALLSAVASAQRTNSINVLYRAVKDMGKDMTPEDFEKSFGVKLADTKYSTPSEFSEAVAKDIKTYADTMDGLRTKMKSQMADPSQFAEGSSNKYVAAMMRNAQEDAIQILAMNAAKGDMTAKRAKQVADDIRSIPAFASSSDFALRVLTNPGAIEGEEGNILGELRILQESLNTEGLDANTKKDIEEQIKLKEQEKKLINTWKTFWENRDTVLGLDKEGKPMIGKTLTNVFTGKRIEKKQIVKDENGNEIDTVDVTFDPADAEVMETFRKLMNIKNKQAKNDTEISEQAMREGFQKIHDYMRLDRDTKDYMRSVDVLMNPEHYKQMLQRMTDGKFKFQLISFVDNILKINMFKAIELSETLNITNEADAIDIYDSIVNAINNSENFKNLAILISNPDLGIAQQEYAIKLHDGLTKELEVKIAELTLKYAPKEYTNDISQDDYDQIIATGKLDITIRNLIAQKLSTGIALSTNEQKIYDIHKAAIDNEVTKPAAKVVTTTPVTKSNETIIPSEEPIIESETEKITYVGDNGEIVENPPANLTAAGQEVGQDVQVDKTLESNEIKPLEEGEFVVQGTFNGDQVIAGNEEYRVKDYRQIGQNGKTELVENTINDKKVFTLVTPNIDIFGRTGYMGVSLVLPNTTTKTREEIESILKKKTEEVNANLDNKIGRFKMGSSVDMTYKDAEPAVVSTPEFDQVSEVEKNSLQATIDFIANNGQPIVEQETPFAPVGNVEEGFDVVDKNNNAINPEKIDTQEQAVELAENLNTARTDLDFVQQLLGPVSETVTIETYTKLMEAATRSMNLFNKRQGTSFTSLAEYYKTPDGKRLVDAIKESVLTGKPVKYSKKKAVVTVTVPENQVTLFEKPSDGQAPSLTLGSLEDLYAKVVEFRKSTLQNSNKMSKFVETETTAPTSVTESSILSKLQDITSCFS